MIDKLENTLIILGVSFGLTEIETILGIIILSFQIILIIYKGIVGVYNSIKNEDYDNIDDTIKDTIDDLKELEKEE